MPPQVGFRSPYKFESSDGTLSYTFPRYSYDYSDDQAMSVSLGQAIGADYGWDHQAYGVSPRNPATVGVRFLLMESTPQLNETALSTCRATCYRIGKGKLWSINRDGTSKRWCWARLTGVPQIEFGVGNIGGAVIPVALSFRRDSDWYDETATTGTQAVTAASTNFNITNPGDINARAVVFRLRSSSAGPGLVSPITIVNNTNAYQLTLSGWTLPGTANDELKVDCGQYKVQQSTDDGSNYTDVYTVLSIPTTQVSIFELAPGVNSITVTTPAGTTSFSLEWSFYGAYI